MKSKFCLIKRTGSTIHKLYTIPFSDLKTHNFQWVIMFRNFGCWKVTKSTVVELTVDHTNQYLEFGDIWGFYNRTAATYADNWSLLWSPMTSLEMFWSKETPGGPICSRAVFRLNTWYTVPDSDRFPHFPLKIPSVSIVDDVKFNKTQYRQYFEVHLPWSTNVVVYSITTVCASRVWLGHLKIYPDM